MQRSKKGLTKEAMMNGNEIMNTNDEHDKEKKKKKKNDDDDDEQKRRKKKKNDELGTQLMIYIIY